MTSWNDSRARNLQSHQEDSVQKQQVSSKINLISVWIKGVHDIKKWWNDFLEKLAKANEKEFGGKAVDCCGLNAQKPLKHRK